MAPRAADANALMELRSGAPGGEAEAYFSALARADGLEAPLSVEPGWIIFWHAASVVAANADYRVGEFLPGFFGFASSGGGSMFAFDPRTPGHSPIVAVPFIPMDPGEAVVVASSFGEFCHALGDPPQ